MEIKIKITEKTDTKLKEVAEELKKVGLEAFADSYYEDDEYTGPFFKIEKPFKKETEKDPEIECIFLDVTHEYTVHTRTGHEHYNDAQKAVEIVKGLFDGTLAEVALCFPSLTARFLIENTGNPEKNIAKMNDNAKSLMDIVNKVVNMLSGTSHIHQLFEAAFPHYLQVLANENFMYGGCQVYLQSIIIGEHAEIYMG